MNSAHLQDMVKGWFVGGFAPTAYATPHCEVAVKRYAAGEREAAPREWRLHKPFAGDGDGGAACERTD